VLVELDLQEQRHKAVLEVLNGATVTDVARRNGVARRTMHDWLRRYARGGMSALRALLLQDLPGQGLAPPPPGAAHTGGGPGGHPPAGRSPSTSASPAGPGPSSPGAARSAAASCAGSATGDCPNCDDPVAVSELLGDELVTEPTRR